MINKSQITKSKFQTKFKTLSFGFDENNDIRGYDIKFQAGQTKFNVNYQGNEVINEFVLKIPGKFNVCNALAAIAVGLILDVEIEKIRKSLAEFGGIWRRFEIKGEYKSANVISDYAHHPTAVKATIEAAREFYPGQRIVAVFQPHQHNRTKELYRDFLKCFDASDLLILSEIFDVAGREEKKDQDVNSRGLAADIKKRLKNLEKKDGSVSPFEKGGVRGISSLRPDNIFYAANLAETRRLIDEKIKAGDVLLVMGAGDIYRIADEIAQ